MATTDPYYNYGTSNIQTYGTYPYAVQNQHAAMLQAQQAQINQQQQLIDQLTRQQMPPGTGNIGDNLNELNEVKAELRRRRGMQPKKPHNQDLLPMPATGDRLFTPLVPPLTHADDHIEWLIGRTRAVQSKLSWAKVA